MMLSEAEERLPDGWAQLVEALGFLGSGFWSFILVKHHSENPIAPVNCNESRCGDALRSKKVVLTGEAFVQKSSEFPGILKLLGEISDFTDVTHDPSFFCKALRMVLFL